MINMNFSVIIPTYKRKKDLNTCIKSVLSQTRFPDEVIIVDDDSLPDDFIQKINNDLGEKGIDLVYHQKNHQKNRRGSSTSRNVGISLALEEICFILDDDLILDENFLEAIMDTWQQSDDADLVGIGGVIKNNRKRIWIENIYSTFFGLSEERQWDVNAVAFQSWDDWIQKKQQGFYVHGGVCAYKKSLVEKLGGFTVFGDGRNALEDIDFCLRAKQSNFHFIIQPLAKVIHNHSSSGREGSFLSGWKEGYNRKVIFRNNCEKSMKNYLWFAWANIGWVSKQFFIGKFAKGAGMIKGLLTS